MRLRAGLGWAQDVGTIWFRFGKDLTSPPRTVITIPSSSPWLWKKDPTVVWFWVNIQDQTYDIRALPCSEDKTRSDKVLEVRIHRHSIIGFG